MIAAYQRISRADGDLGKDGKDKSNSIENQKELIQRYISHKESLQNLPVMDFVDDGYTGSNFDRPGFQKMMDGVRSGEIDTIIVKDLRHLVSAIRKGRVLSKGGTRGKNQCGSRAAAEIPSSKKTANRADREAFVGGGPALFWSAVQNLFRLTLYL